MRKIILEKNFDQLNNLFKEKKFSEFEKNFLNYEQKNILCEKSFNLYGVYLTKNENYLLSVKYFEKSLNQNSNYNIAKTNLSGVFYKLGEYSKAQKLLEEILSKDEKNIYSLRLLSNIYSKIQYQDNEEKILKKIIIYYPVDFQAYYDLGLFYYKNNDLHEAEINFKKSIQLNAKFFPSNYYLALTYKSKKKIKDSEFILNSLIINYPKIKEAYYTLSDIYRGKGEFEKSNEILDRVLNEIDHSDTFSFYQLLSSPHYKNKKKIFDYCKENYFLFDNDFQERVGYALFKYFDQQKDYLNAAKYLKNSLKITSSKYNYSSKIDNDQFNFLKKVFDHKFKKNLNLCSKNTKNIFIVGMQRSGSTLLEQILTTHENLVSFGELPFFADLITKYYPNQNLNTFEKDIKNSKEAYFLEIGQEYNKKLQSIKSFTISIDKMLSNFRMIGFLMASIPNCLVINIYRNKHDNLFSILSNYFENFSAPWSYNEEDLKNYYDNYLSLMDHWKSIYPNNIIDVCYENLINDPKNEIEKILNKCNITWSENFLNFEKNTNIVETASVYQVRQPLYDTSIGRWKNYKNYFPKLFEN